VTGLLYAVATGVCASSEGILCAVAFAAAASAATTFGKQYRDNPKRSIGRDATLGVEAGTQSAALTVFSKAGGEWNKRFFKQFGW